MTTVASLDNHALTAAPGGDVSCELLVQNRGEIVEGYRITVLGEAAAWASVDPSNLSVYPGTQAVARITFRVPRGYDVPVTDIPFGVHVVPVEHPGDAVVPEGTLRVGAYAETTAELVPRTSRTRRVAEHDVAVDNRGNAPLRVALVAGDQDNALKLKVRPAALVVPPGETAIAQVTARHRQMHWRGQPVARPFQVEISGDDSMPIRLDGTSIQQPVLAMWLPKLLAMLAALAILVTALWFGLLKPAVQSAAQDAVKPSPGPNAAVKNNADGGGGPAAPAGGASATPTQGAAVNQAANPSPSAAPVVAGAPQSMRIDVEAPNGQTRNNSAANVPTGKAFRLTDLVIGNRQGDTGEMEIIAGDQRLATVSLFNFRQDEYHWATPIVIPAGKQVTLRVTCATAGAPVTSNAQAGRCREYITFSGVMLQASNP
jgi:hypothetical protein